MGLLAVLMDMVSAIHRRIPEAPEGPDWLPETGSWDLYGFMLIFATSSTALMPLFNDGPNWRGMAMTVPLVLWYIRYAGLQTSTYAYP